MHKDIIERSSSPPPPEDFTSLIDANANSCYLYHYNRPKTSPPLSQSSSVASIPVSPPSSPKPLSPPSPGSSNPSSPPLAAPSESSSLFAPIHRRGRLFQTSIRQDRPSPPKSPPSSRCSFRHISPPFSRHHKRPSPPPYSRYSDRHSSPPSPPLSCHHGKLFHPAAHHHKSPSPPPSPPLHCHRRHNHPSPTKIFTQTPPTTCFNKPIPKGRAPSPIIGFPTDSNHRYVLWDTLLILHGRSDGPVVWTITWGDWVCPK